jgi:hypothetical protein
VDQPRHRHDPRGSGDVGFRLAGKVDLAARGVDVARMIAG